jgi:hypothetical protein
MPVICEVLEVIEEQEGELALGHRVARAFERLI